MPHSSLFWIHAMTPLHVGAGRGLGYIDLPIVREKVTNFPYIPGSAVKGVIADHYNATEDNRKNNPQLATAFGKADDRENDKGTTSNSGSLVFTDARLVCLPVRSMLGTFAWCTSPTILRRLHRDITSAGMTVDVSCELNVSDEKAMVCPNNVVASDEKIYLEDLDIGFKTNDNAKKWADYIAKCLFDGSEREEFVKRFVILSDNIFNFLCETGTEVAAHIKIKEDTKTVADGALWYEESLPAESILMGILWCDKVYGNPVNTEEELLKSYAKDIPMLQFGGKATTGKGIVRCVFDKGENQNANS